MSAYLYRQICASAYLYIAVIVSASISISVDLCISLPLYFYPSLSFCVFSGVKKAALSHIWLLEGLETEVVSLGPALLNDKACVGGLMFEEAAAAAPQRRTVFRNRPLPRRNPSDPHKHKDPTICFGGPFLGRYQRPWCLGSLRLSGLLGLYPWQRRTWIKALRF